MSNCARNVSSGGTLKRVLIFLCALAPIAAGLLMPDREPAQDSRAPSQPQGGAWSTDASRPPPPPDGLGSVLDITRFDARARAKQRDLLRERRIANPQSAWSRLLERHTAGDETALSEFLATVTPENAIDAWKAAQGVKLSPDDRSSLYRTLGRVGRGDLVRQLIDRSDRDAALAVEGWANAEPAAAVDWFRGLDVDKDPRMQEYLAASSLMPEGFLDRVSDSLLDSLSPGLNEAATRLVESLLSEDSRKGEAMMRELTERFIDQYDSDAVVEWFNQLDNPDAQSAAIQRIIEAGTFRDNPFQAVDVALSLEDPKSRATAISAAFGQLGSGAGDVDPGSVAQQLNSMPAGRDKDFAINGFAHGLVGSSPRTALEWAGSIADDGFRATVERNINRRIEAQSRPEGN